MSFSAPISTAVADVAAVSPSIAVSSEVPNTSFAPEVPVIAPQEKQSYENIEIYPESISPSSSNDPSCAVFDIILSVNWTCPATGEYKRAKVLKTISFSKTSLTDQTFSQQVAFVESTQPEIKKDHSKLLNTLRELAGVSGERTFC